jgi:hypothetical protein
LNNRKLDKVLIHKIIILMIFIIFIYRTWLNRKQWEFQNISEILLKVESNTIISSLTVKPFCFEVKKLTTLVVLDTVCIGSYKSNYTFVEILFFHLSVFWGWIRVKLNDSISLVNIRFLGWGIIDPFYFIGQCRYFFTHIWWYKEDQTQLMKSSPIFIPLLLYYVENVQENKKNTILANNRKSWK